MKVAFLGATKGMGRALARLMASRGDELFLLGRTPGDLERSAADLQARGGEGGVGFARCDLAEPDQFRGALQAASHFLGSIDAVVVTAGVFAPQQELEQDADRTREVLSIDFTHTVLFCEEARKLLLADKGGTLCVFSSVAGERSRKPVVLYGAAKAGLTAYLEGLDHRFYSQGLRVVCVKPGFVKTSMTATLSPPPFAGEVEAVARQVLRAIDRRKAVIYAPPAWRLIMAVIRRLPRSIMRKISF